MNNYIIRKATLKDLDFLTEAIIQAEKGGTENLSYNTIFGLTVSEAKFYISKILEEEIEGCDFSLSGFLIAEKNGEPAAALNAWVEGIDGLSSVILKGNLLNYYLPKESLIRAKQINHIFSDLSIREYIHHSLWIGYAYVAPEHRGCLLLIKLYHQHIHQMKQKYPWLKEVYCQIFSNNIASIQNFKLLKFQIIKEYVAFKEVSEYLPSNRKFVLHKLI